MYDPTRPLPADLLALNSIVDQIPDDGHRQIVQVLVGFAADYASRVEDSVEDRANLHTAVNTLTAKTLTVRRYTTQLTAITVGGTLTTPITWPTPFPDATYDVHPSVLNVQTGKATYTTTNQTAASCTITIKPAAGIAVALGSTLDVIATRYA